MSELDAELWSFSFSFEPGPDFTLTVRGETIGRVQHEDTKPRPPYWGWSITCVRQFVGMTKPSKTDSGYVETKQEAVDALRATWALERDWRAEMRALTAYHDAGMSHRVAFIAWETYERPAYVELRELEGLAQGLGLEPMKAWAIQMTVAEEMAACEANRDERMAEVWKRMLAAARGN